MTAALKASDWLNSQLSIVMQLIPERPSAWNTMYALVTALHHIIVYRVHTSVSWSLSFHAGFSLPTLLLMVVDTLYLHFDGDNGPLQQRVTL